jgi:hypothetical protein
VKIPRSQTHSCSARPYTRWQIGGCHHSGRLSGYKAFGLTVDHSVYHFWKVSRSLHLFFRFRKRVGTLFVAATKDLLFRPCPICFSSEWQIKVVGPFLSHFYS